MCVGYTVHHVCIHSYVYWLICLTHGANVNFTLTAHAYCTHFSMVVTSTVHTSPWWLHQLCTLLYGGYINCIHFSMVVTSTVHTSPWWLHQLCTLLHGGYINCAHWWLHQLYTLLYGGCTQLYAPLSVVSHVHMSS